MKICNFTQSELDILRNECNFTEIESECFELKAKDCKDFQLAMKLNISESTVAVIMRRVRTKIDTVLRQHAKSVEYTQTTNCGQCPSKVYHTMEEWARIPDFLSTKGTEYIYADYRTEVVNGIEVNIPRIKYGDGIHRISELPFATIAATDEDVEYWDNKPDTANNDFGKIVEIDSKYSKDNKFVFPTDGYLMLEFDNAIAFAKVNIYGANGNSFFTFEKPRQIDIHSKEVFVKRGMECEYVYSSDGAKIRFVPLV